MLHQLLRVFVVSVFIVTAAFAQEIEQEQLQELLKVKIRTVQHMALNPMLVAAVRDSETSILLSRMDA